MKFSVVVPVYNCEKYIDRCIESIKNQSHQDWELIIMNDGSTDSSLAICRQYEKQDNRISVFSEPNSGPGTARNKALRHITGEYVIFCDSDDFYESYTLSLYADVLSKHPYDLITSGYNEFIYINGEAHTVRQKSVKPEIIAEAEIKPRYISLIQKSLINASWARVYKADIIKKYNIQFDTTRRYEDVVFNLRYFEHIKSLYVQDKPTYNYQTAGGIKYIRKFPASTFDILIKVYKLQTSTLERWGVLDDDTKIYIDSRLLHEVAIVFRLNYMNNWNLSKKEKWQFYKKMLDNETLSTAASHKIKGRLNKLIAFIVRRKSTVLFHLFSGGTILYQVLKKQKNK